MGATVIDCADGDLTPLELVIASIDETDAMRREREETEAAIPQPDHDAVLVVEAERASDDGEDNSQ
jgi:hypothetical protein